MKTIAFYISDHGFGHASRNIPIIRYILEVNKNVNIIIKTGTAQGNFIKDVLGNFNERVSYYFNNMDVGLVLKYNSLDIDVDKLTLKVEEYIASFDKKVKKENVFLIQHKVDLVVSDIVPWIFKSTKTLNIKSILISNFTWVEIYREHLNYEICNEYIKCYKLADKALFYELYMEEMKEYIMDYEKVSLCARDFDLKKADKIKNSFKRKIVFVSVGRSVNLNEEIDVSGLDYDFIVTDGIKLKGHNVYYLDKETSNTQDYLMASDYVITKAGWGTISEALLGKKRIAVLSRDNVAEDRNTITRLKEKRLAIEVEFNNELFIKKILKDLETFNPEFERNTFNNDYKKIGNIIMSKIGEKEYGKKE